MSSAKTTTKNTAKQARKRLANIKRRLGHHYGKVDTSQPSQVLKRKQTLKVKTNIAEAKRREMIQKQIDFYLQKRAPPNSNSNSDSNSNSNSDSNSNSNSSNNNSYPGYTIASIRATIKKNANKKRKTRKAFH
jgi:hypothetical protein